MGSKTLVKAGIITIGALIVYMISFGLWHYDMLSTFDMYIITGIFSAILGIDIAIYCKTSNRNGCITGTCTTDTTDESNTDNSLNRWL